MAEAQDWPDLFLSRDWDYFASMAQTLRSYLYDYHTIPTWNFMLCGGKPELANPQSWAFTWPSLLVYLLPPNAALIALWVIMSIVGWCGMVGLLRRLGVQTVGAITGATLYLANGYFAAQIVVGHVSFAFYHLVPVMILYGLKLYDRWQLEPKERGRTWRLYAGNTALAFLFFSAALPHPLFYFYGALPLVLVVAAATALRRGTPRGKVINGLAVVAATQVIGVLLAGYKLWPVIAWQLAMPRHGVLPESIALPDLLGDLVRFVPDYGETFASVVADQSWFAWEYGAYVGFTPFLLLIGAAVLVRQHRAKVAATAAAWPLALSVGAVAGLLGLNLAGGNDHPLSLSQFFKYLPLLGGVRVFARYQILEIFGLACMVGLAMDVVIRRVPQAQRGLAASLLFAFATGPGLWQAATLLTTFSGQTTEQLAALYTVRPAPDGACPLMLKQTEDLKRGRWDQTFMLRSGYWVANCYEPMVGQRPKVSGADLPLTWPPPAKLIALSSDSIELAYDTLPSTPVRINLGSQLAFDAPSETDRFGITMVTLAAKDGAVRLTARRTQTSTRQGLWLSAVGLMLNAAALWELRRRQRLAPP